MGKNMEGRFGNIHKVASQGVEDNANKAKERKRKEGGEGRRTPKEKPGRDTGKERGMPKKEIGRDTGRRRGTWKEGTWAMDPGGRVENRKGRDREGHWKKKGNLEERERGPWGKRVK